MMDDLITRAPELLLRAMDDQRKAEDEKRGRSLASSHEVWAVLKDSMDAAANAASPIAKLHKEMWDSVKSSNDEMLMAEVQTVKNAALQAAMEYIRLAALAESAMGPLF